MTSFSHISTTRNHNYLLTNENVLFDHENTEYRVFEVVFLYKVTFLEGKIRTEWKIYRR